MGAQMSSRERVLAAFRGEPYDRIPLISPVSLVNLECMQASRSFFPRACLNTSKIVALAETSYHILHFDSVAPYFGIANEAGALGCRVDWGSSDHLPDIHEGFLQNLSDYQPPVGYLNRRPIRAIIDAIRSLKKSLNNEVAIFGKIIGPMSLIFSMYGIQNTLNSLILEPQVVQQVLYEVNKLCIDFAIAQIEAGADIITISEDAAGDLISRGFYENILMDVEASLHQALCSDVYTVFHLSCEILDRADLFARTGFHALSFDSRNDLRQLKKITAPMKLIGCVNNPVTLLNGQREDVIQEVLYNIRSGIDMVAPECAIPLRVSNENLLAMYRAVQIYHAHPRKNR